MKSSLPSVVNRIVSVSSEHVISLFNKGAKISGTEIRQISPHIKVASAVVIENVVKKSDYAEDLKVLVNAGMSVKNAAATLGISISYAYKLLKK